MNSTTLSKYVADAVASSAPGKDRENALKRVRWILETEDGSFVRSGVSVSTVDDPAKATVFDGRDNEAAKTAFFSSLLKKSVKPILI
jgi:hypothetical protein